MDLPTREAHVTAEPFLIPVGVFLDQDRQLGALHGTLKCRLATQFRACLFQEFLGKVWTEKRMGASHGIRPLPGPIAVSLSGRGLYHTMSWNPDIICETDHLA